MKTFLTFGLDLFTVGRDNDALDLTQLHVFGDLSEAHDEAAFRLGLVRVLLGETFLETDKLLEEERHALVNLLAQYLVTVPVEGNKNDTSV